MITFASLNTQIHALHSNYDDSKSSFKAATWSWAILYFGAALFLGKPLKKTYGRVILLLRKDVGCRQKNIIITILLKLLQLGIVQMTSTEKERGFCYILFSFAFLGKVYRFFF